MITQKDIAKKAGVHQSHVSLALKNHPAVALETRKKIQAIAKQMGYRPNAALSEAAANRWRQPKGLRRETVAFLATTRWPEEKTFPVVEAANRQLDILGYNMQHINPLDYSSEKTLSEALYDQGIRGVIIEQQRETDRQRQLDWDKFVIVQAGMLIDYLRTHRVMLNFPALINEATARVTAAGYRRICYILAQPTLYDSDYLLMQAVIGAIQLQSTNGIVGHICPYHYNILNEKTIQTQIRKFKPDIILLSENKRLMDAVNDFDIPKVALIRDHCSEILPGFASQFEQLGEHTADLLDSRMRSHDFGIPQKPHHIVFIPPWKEDVKLPTKR